MAAIAEISSDWSRVVLEVTEPGFDTFIWNCDADDLNKLLGLVNESKLSIFAKMEARNEILYAGRKIALYRQSIYDRQAKWRFYSVVFAFVIALLAFFGLLIWG
jgi:hypothetical protein